MRSKVLGLILTVTMLISLAGCSRNNGDIGVWFGLWKVESVEVDDAPDADYGGNLFFQFQSTVFNMRMVSDRHVYTDRFGNWEEADGVLKITFPDERYVPFEVTRMGRECRLTIEKKTGKEIVLSFVQAETGKTVRFRLVKWV